MRLGEHKNLDPYWADLNSKSVALASGQFDIHLRLAISRKVGAAILSATGHFILLETP